LLLLLLLLPFASLARTYLAFLASNVLLSTIISAAFAFVSADY
jgi:hypothetical protein